MTDQPLGYGDLIAAVTDLVGVRFTLEDTGGGCLLFQGRLEGGNWLVISDWDAGILPLDRRRDLEVDGVTVGWNVSIYADDGDNWPDHQTWLASVRHESARADDLPGLVELALSGLRDNTHHDFRRDGSHSVSYGVVKL